MKNYHHRFVATAISIAIAVLSLACFDPVLTAHGLSQNQNRNRNQNRNQNQNQINVQSVVQNVVDGAASRIPTAWKRDSITGQPYACKAIEGTLGVATRLILLGGGTTPNTDIVVGASSNRAALTGTLRKLSIDVRNSRSPLGLLEAERVSVEGSDLKLGWTPLITTTGIPLVLFVSPIRSVVWTASVYCYFWTVVKRLVQNGVTSQDPNIRATTLNINSKMEATQAVVHRYKTKLLGGSPSQLTYEVVLSNDNLAQSTLLRQASKFLLRFLMKNSVLQTAARVGDAVSDTQTINRKRLERENELRLKSASAGGNSNPLSNQLAKITHQNQQQQQSQSQQPFRTTEAPQNKLSRLLSATAFELREPPTFQYDLGKNHLQFVSVAKLPDNNNNNNNNAAQLDFILRTTVEGGNGKGDLRFVQPECRFDVGDAVPLPKMVSDFLPKVLWLPIGPGIALGGGGNANANSGGGGGGLSIRDVEVIPGDKCRIRGKLSVGRVPPSSRGGLVRR